MFWHIIRIFAETLINSIKKYNYEKIIYFSFRCLCGICFYIL